MDLSGVICPVVTPFVDNRFAPDQMARNLEKWHTSKVSGYAVLGSTGEVPLLTTDERIAVVRTARAHVDRNKTLIVGTGFESTTETIDFIKRISEVEVDGVLVITPHYYKAQMSDEVYVDHFSTIAEHSPVPIIVYNVPKFTGVDMSTSVISKLSSHANIVGIKDSTDKISKISDLSTYSSVDFTVLIGNFSLFFHGLFSGLSGAVLAVANFASNACVDIHKRFDAKDYEGARTLFMELKPIAERIVGKYGVPGVKAALDICGYYGGAPRKPLMPLSEIERSGLKKLLQESKII